MASIFIGRVDARCVEGRPYTRVIDAGLRGWPSDAARIAPERAE